MARRVALLLVLALLGAVGAPSAGARPATAKAKVRCHWVKATKHRKRHRVCVKVKRKKKTSTAAAKPSPTPSTAPAPSAAVPAPVLPAAPVIADPLPAPEPVEPAPAPAPAAARLQVTAREFSLTLSRASLVAGPAIVELVNRGEDPHDLHVRPAAGGADVLSIAETLPGGVVEGEATLAPGAYTLYCALPGHEAAGMKAALSVG